MNDYQISKLKKELQRKQQLLKEEQQDRQQTQQQLVQVSAERDKYHTELLIARKQIENIDKIIAENVKTMKSKLQEENFNSLNQLKDLRQKLKGQQFLNQKLVEENRNKDATIAELSARLREMSKKYKDPSLLVNTKEISEQAMITHNQFYKLTEKYNKLSKDMENIMAENKILRKLHGVPDNFGFDLEEIKIAEKQQLEDYKAQCRKLQTEIQELEAERTQLRYRLRQYNTLYSNKGERYKDMTQQQLELLDQYAMNLKEGKFELPQIDKSQKQMERQILKLRAQVEVLQNKAPMSIMQMSTGNTSNNDKLGNEQMKKIQDQIKSYLQPFVQDMKKVSESNLNGLIQNLQTLQNNQNVHSLNSELGVNIPAGNFKGPIPLPIAHNDWSQIKEGYSFLYSSKIPVDLKDLEGDVSFDVIKAKYEIAALQLQNIESLKLLKEKQKVENHLSKQIFELKQKYKKCLKVQDQLFIRYFKDKEAVNDKIKKLQIEKHQLSNEKNQLEAKLDVVTTSFNDLSKKGDLEKRMKEYTERLAIREAEVLKLQRKYQIIQQEEKTLRETFTKLQGKLNETEHSLRTKLTTAKNNERELTVLVNKILDEVKDSVSSEVHNILLEKMQLMNDKASNMINKETELRLKIEKLQGLQRDSAKKDNAIENLREDNLELLLELEIIKNRLKLVDMSYRTFTEVLQRFIKFINQNNTSLMKCFKKFDRDNSGYLSKKELGDALKDLGFPMTEAELELLFAEFDVDGSEQLTYKEFIKKMRRAGAISRTKDEDAVLRLFKAICQSNVSIKRAFEIIDKDGSGQITKPEMSSALSQIGITATTQTINYLFKLCDNDGDQRISCQQLERLYNEMIKESENVEDQIYSEQLDWKLAFVLKLEEVSLRFNSSLAETFKRLDDDGNAILTMTELIEFLKKSEMQMDSSALKELFDFLDRRRDGKVEYGEFLKVLSEAKSEQQRIDRIKYVKERTKQLKAESQANLASQSMTQSHSTLTKNSEIEKLKIRLQALTAKHSNLLKRNEELAKELAKNEQKVKQLERSLQVERKEKMSNLDKYHQERLSKITMQSIAQKSRSQEGTAPLKRELNELKIRNTEIINDLQLYKNLYEGLTDKNKGEEMRVGKLQAERNKYYDIVKDLQGTSDFKAELGKLHIQLEYSKRNEEIVNSKYDKIVEELRKVDGESMKLSSLSGQKQKQIINTHIFFQQKCKLQQLKIDDLSLKIIPAITMQKMQDYLIKLRDISNSKSNLEQQNYKIRQSNYNLQARNDYVQNQKLHIEQLQRKLRNQYTDDSSKTIIDLTKKLSDYKMSELKAKRELSLLKQKEEYYLRIHNNHNENIKELEEELSNWEVKYNQREEFWRKRLADQIKLMEEFQREANKAKQQQITAVNYFNHRKQEQQSVNKKYQGLNQNNLNNISQFIRPENNQYSNNNNNDEYVEGLLDKCAKLEQQLMDKEKEIYHFKSTIKDIIPETNLNKLMDFGSQMNISTNSFVLQTDLTSSQLKTNARRFLNGQKQVEAYYKEENARITQAAQQSIETLQRIIDDKNQQLRKKQRMIQDLKKQFNQITEKDCLEIQKLHQEIRELRSKTQLNSINQIMSKTTKNNFYPSSKAETKLEEYQKLFDGKDMEIRNLQQKYDKLLITKTTAQNEKTSAKNAVNSEKLKQKLEELTFERETEKKKFQQKEKELNQQVNNLKKMVTTKTKKIEQLNNALRDIKQDIINEKNTLTESETENNLKTFVETMSKGSNKNDAVMEQYMQSALLKIKNLQGQNKDLKEELGRAKDVASKTANRFGR